MLCLGSLYAWSIFVPELKSKYEFSTAQTQLIFGTVIIVFTLTMIWAAKLNKKLGPHVVATFSGLIFLLGYVVAYLSKGNFYFLWFGIGILGGIGTGLGYFVSLTVPVKWFPEKKGLVTGIIAAGFGIGAIVLTYIAELLLKFQMDVLKIFLYTGLIYGIVIIFLAQKIREPNIIATNFAEISISLKDGVLLYQLIIGIFAGTFTGLLVIGNLKPIALTQNINESTITLAIALFALSNFSGRIVWGWLNDFFSNTILVPIALILQGVAALGLIYFQKTDLIFIVLVLIVGFCFGTNFVLFARDTIQKFGIGSYEKMYPYIFLGYGVAGILGPVVGGRVFDTSGSYFYALIFAFVLSVMASLIYVLVNKIYLLKLKNRIINESNNSRY